MIARYLDPLRERWMQLQPREQWVLGAGIVFVLLTTLVYGLIQPVLDARGQARERLQAERQIAIDLERAAASLGSRGPAAAAGGRNQTLISVVDRSIRSSAIGKPASRLQPDGDTRARVWIEDARFDALVRWLAELESRHGVQLDGADIDRSSGAGLVDARLTLVRP